MWIFGHFSRRHIVKLHYNFKRDFLGKPWFKFFEWGTKIQHLTQRIWWCHQFSMDFFFLGSWTQERCVGYQINRLEKANPDRLLSGSFQIWSFSVWSGLPATISCTVIIKGRGGKSFKCNFCNNTFTANKTLAISAPKMFGSFMHTRVHQGQWRKTNPTFSKKKICTASQSLQQVLENVWVILAQKCSKRAEVEKHFQGNFSSNTITASHLCNKCCQRKWKVTPSRKLSWLDIRLFPI